MNDEDQRARLRQKAVLGIRAFLAGFFSGPDAEKKG
jgi:hypothetical protein